MSGDSGAKPAATKAGKTALGRPQTEGMAKRVAIPKDRRPDFTIWFFDVFDENKKGGGWRERGRY
jgi:hypothetical protein